jgi:hypothetical protein
MRNRTCMTIHKMLSLHSTSRFTHAQGFTHDNIRLSVAPVRTKHLQFYLLLRIVCKVTCPYIKLNVVTSGVKKNSCIPVVLFINALNICFVVWFEATLSQIKNFRWEEVQIVYMSILQSSVDLTLYTNKLFLARFPFVCYVQVQGTNLAIFSYRATYSFYILFLLMYWN